MTKKTEEKTQLGIEHHGDYKIIIKIEKEMEERKILIRKQENQLNKLEKREKELKKL